MSPVVSVKNLSCQQGGTILFSGANFEAWPGDVIAITGPNGAGKTTFVRTILGLMRPAAGEVIVRADKKGYVPQRINHEAGWLPFTVAQVVGFGAGSDTQALEEALEVMGLWEFRRRFWGELSGGQRQRTLIARAVATRAPLLVMDEPTAGLDQASMERFYSWLERRRQMGGVIFFVTHDCSAIASIEHRLVVIDRGLREVAHGRHRC
ncbi:MAG: metal ABC transporter ATP-binding protein [Campylobacterales bacterium]